MTFLGIMRKSLQTNLIISFSLAMLDVPDERSLEQ